MKRKEQEEKRSDLKEAQDEKGKVVVKYVVRRSAGRYCRVLVAQRVGRHVQGKRRGGEGGVKPLIVLPQRGGNVENVESGGGVGHGASYSDTCTWIVTI
jgi:hypothetical protein